MSIGLFNYKLVYQTLINIMESKKFKCILSGDSRVGKTSLLKTYLEGKFPSKIQGFNDVIVNKKFSFDG